MQRSTMNSYQLRRLIGQTQCNIASSRQVQDSDGNSKLFLATALQLPGAVRRLLKAGADPALALDRAGLGPLHLAARNCDRRLFDLLLSQGVK